MLRIKKVHLVGIGGAGMSGIAEVLFNLNYTVTGSDLQPTGVTDRLAKMGIQITYSHIPENVMECDVVVASSAVPAHNIELLTARKRRIPVVPRAEMLAELMRFKHGIAVAGTHGKTTTTSLIATLLAEDGKDPTFVIGGRLNHLQTNAKLGSGEYFVAEADESDASFLHLNPMTTVITNIDQDHLSAYDNDFKKLKRAFVEFIHRLPFYGLLLVCIDDPHIQEILPEISRHFLTYGLSPQADICAVSWQQEKNISKVTARLPGDELLQFSLNLPGKHNVQNALAAIGIATELGVATENILSSLKAFSGIERRLQILGDFDLPIGNVLMIDDYGHHPNEVKAVLAAIKQGWPNRRIVMVYQPHRYTRNRDLFNEFVAVLSTVGVLLLLEVYSAGEAPIVHVDSKALCRSINDYGNSAPILVENKQNLFALLQNVLRADDILLLQGAGDISKVARELHKQFQQELQCVV